MNEWWRGKKLYVASKDQRIKKVSYDVMSKTLNSSAHFTEKFHTWYWRHTLKNYALHEHKKPNTCREKKAEHDWSRRTFSLIKNGRFWFPISAKVKKGKSQAINCFSTQSAKCIHTRLLPCVLLLVCPVRYVNSNGNNTDSTVSSEDVSCDCVKVEITLNFVLKQFFWAARN